MLRVTSAKRPTCGQILNTSIISSRLSTLFPNEINDAENILLQTIYVPKKLSHLTDRLPKATYEENDATEDETVFSRLVDTQDEPEIFPKIIMSTQKVVSINPAIVKTKENLIHSGKYSDYSFDSHISK